MRGFWLLLGVIAAGCASTAYRCDPTHACNAGSTCTAAGYCAEPVAAATCASGLRYSASAASPGACVAAPDAAVDTPASMDGPPGQDAPLDTAEEATAGADAAPDLSAETGVDAVEADAAPDAALDAVPDAALDAAPDAPPDVGLDAAPDAAPEVGADVPVDRAADLVSMDLPRDAAPDAAPDVALDVALDAPRDVALDLSAAPDVSGPCTVRPVAPLAGTRVSRSSTTIVVAVTGAVASVFADVGASPGVTPTRVALTPRVDGRYEATVTATGHRLFWRVGARCGDGTEARGPAWWTWNRRTMSNTQGLLGWVPDVSGDGLGDLVVSAVRPTDAPTPPPLVQVFVGSATGGGGGETLTRPTPDLGFGSRVAIVPDMNGDGAAEVAVSTCAREPLSPCAQSVFVYTRNAATGVWSFYHSVAMPPVTMATPGLRTDARFGATLAGVGDLDGDGYGDLLIGAPPAASPDAGAFYLLYGGPSPALSPGYSLTASMATSPPRTHFAWSAAGVGDLTGDGLMDFVVTSYQYAWVYRGNGARGISTSEELAVSVRLGERYGFSAAAAGDLDGDHLADLALGRGDGSDNGRVTAVLGRAATFTGLTETGRGVLTVEGPPAGTHFGATVLGALDLTGDDRDELIVGAPAGAALFAAWVFGGGLVTQRYGGTLAVSGRLGRALGATGDHNGDGYDDFAAGAVDSMSNAGAVLRFRGAATMAPEPFVFVSAATNALVTFGAELGR